MENCWNGGVSCYKKSFIPKEEKTDIQTKFKPLNQGAIFNGKVRFHNLKKAEVGALLSALTFHGHDGYRHNLGMAKALGYGKIKIDIGLHSLKHTKEEYLKAYEEEMTLFKDDWIHSSQLKELFAMANNEILNDENLKYQKLENPIIQEKEKNDFVRAKKNREYLQRYSQIGNVQPVPPKSLLNDEEIDELIEKRKYEKKYNSELKVIKQSQNIDQIKSFLKKYSDAKDKNDLENQIALIEKEQQERKEARERKEVADLKAEEDIKKAKEDTKKAEEERKKQEKLAKGLDFSQAKDIKNIMHPKSQTNKTSIFIPRC